MLDSRNRHAPGHDDSMTDADDLNADDLEQPAHRPCQRTGGPHRYTQARQLKPAILAPRQRRQHESPGGCRRSVRAVNRRARRVNQNIDPPAITTITNACRTGSVVASRATCWTGSPAASRRCSSSRRLVLRREAMIGCASSDGGRLWPPLAASGRRSARCSGDRPKIRRQLVAVGRHDHVSQRRRQPGDQRPKSITLGLGLG
jgi:hypothetical protein